MRVGIIIILLFISGGLSSQISYREIDSTSYAFYLSSNWNELIELSKQNKEHSYHYYNVRVGMAYFFTNDFKSAAAYFSTALDQNNNELAREYLYWAYSYLGYLVEAEKEFALLSKETKDRINRVDIPIIGDTYLEAGTKLSQDTSVAKNLNYIGLQAQLNLNKLHGLAVKYSFANQTTNWGNFNQNEFCLQSNKALKKGWTLSSNLSYYQYQSSLSFFADETIQGEPFTVGTFTIDSLAVLSTRYIGTLNQNSLFVGTGVKKWINKFFVQGQVHHYASANTSNYFQILGGEYTYNVSSNGFTNSSQVGRFDTTFVDTISKVNTTQLGFSIDYLIKAKKFSIQPGLQMAYAISDTNRFSLVPQLAINCEKWGLQLSYLQKKEQSLYLMTGNTLINTRNNIDYRWGLTTRFKLSDKLDLYLTGQIDQQKDFFSLQTYNTYSFFTGLNFRL
ncbi:hypothetical protein N9V83_02230 [Flavobacteriales bacterium]|jgi:hypothetical protein|nr:hypothetical protein [Flavobacteriales bacterium]